MINLETDQLAELIRQKRECLIRLRDMGKKQLELVAKGGMTDLLDLLAAKRRFLLEFQRIEHDLDPFRDQVPEERRWRTEKDRKQCAKELAQCETLLAEIIEGEKYSEADLRRQRDITASQLQSVHAASQARNAYAGSQNEKINQLDLFSEDGA